LCASVDSCLENNDKGRVRHAGMDCPHPGRRDASGDVHVNLGSSTPCWNDDTEANAKHRKTVA
jgi:hypothetical protein